MGRLRHICFCVEKGRKDVDAMTENLKICPFCGSEAEISGYDNGMYQCVCQNCKSTQGVFYDFPEEAAFAWNNRPIEDLKDDENAWLEKNLKDYNRVMLENMRLREALELIAKSNFYFARGEEDKQLSRVCEIARNALNGNEK